MTKVMTLNQFSTAYKTQNPHDRVTAPKAIRIQWGTLVPMFIGLIAANILSAFHTGPLVAKAYATITGTPENVFMATMGVLAVEFVVFMLMFVSWDNTTRKEKVLRIAVIFIAISVSAIANVNATIINLGTSDTASTIAGGLVGIFAPLANLALAEVLRLVLGRTKQEKELADVNYKAELMKWDVAMRTRYAQYLKKYGITDPTAIMKLSNGEDLDNEVLPQSTTERVMGQDRPVKTEKQAYPPRIRELATKIVANNDRELSYKALQDKYRVGPADVSKVKRYLEQ